MAGFRARSGSAIAHGAHGSSQVGNFVPLRLLSSLSAPSLDHLCNYYEYFYAPMASGLMDLLYCCSNFCGGCCDDGELGDNRGLRHAGEEHRSSSPGSASYACTTLSRLKFILKLDGFID